MAKQRRPKQPPRPAAPAIPAAPLAAPKPSSDDLVDMAAQLMEAQAEAPALPPDDDPHQPEAQVLSEQELLDAGRTALDLRLRYEAALVNLG